MPIPLSLIDNESVRFSMCPESVIWPPALVYLAALGQKVSGKHLGETQGSLHRGVPVPTGSVTISR